MKKVFILTFIFIMLMPIRVYAKEEKLLSNADSGILIEVSTGNIIYEKNKDKKAFVASLTKMVVQTIILENLEKGKIKLSDVVTISKNAADMGGSQIYLTEGEKMTVKDLLKGISVASGNDATVAMAEYIGGSEEKFVKMMNDKAKELGLKNTSFKNSTGLDEKGHYSTAYDMAIVARNLILNHEQILKYSSIYEDYLRKGTENEFWLVNTNKLIRYYEGADGLKTGHTDNAKYCLAATAKKNNMRLLAIVLGEEKAKVRNNEAMNLLDYGFNNKKISTLLNKNKAVEKVRVSKGDKNSINALLKRDLTVLQDKITSKHKYTYKIKMDSLCVPIKKNDLVGKIKVYENNKFITEGDLISDRNVNELSYFELYINTLKNSILGIN